jgi:hypothetical protein
MVKRLNDKSCHSDHSLALDQKLLRRGPIGKIGGLLSGGAVAALLGELATRGAFA